MNDDDDDLEKVNDDTNVIEDEASDDADLVAGNVMKDDDDDIEEINDDANVIEDDADGHDYFYGKTTS
jgi:hypothetical protein